MLLHRLRNQIVDTMGWLVALTLGATAVYYVVPLGRFLLWKYAP
jgi:hypothetical protein